MNQNEVLIDGKKYIQKIAKCTCKEKQIDKSGVVSYIINRRGHEYTYLAGTDYLQNDDKSKTLYLMQDAKESVLQAIQRMEKVVNDAEIAFDGSKEKVNVYYEPASHFSADYPLKVYTSHGCRYLSYKQKTLDEIIFEMDLVGHGYGGKHFKDLETLEKHPLYKMAKANQDEKKCLELRVYFHKEKKDDWKLYERLFGCKVLPCLSSDFDKNYVVNTQECDYKLLKRSGYTVLHQAYYAMKGYTHEKWLLNPHTKSGIDAAPENSVSIPFSEFLSLFNEENLEKGCI